jgi:hypothetical protein
MRIEEAVQVVESTRSGLLSNERIYRAVHVHEYRLKEVADFVGLDCSAISSIANRAAEAKNTKNKGLTPAPVPRLGQPLPSGTLLVGVSTIPTVVYSMQRVTT